MSWKSGFAYQWITAFRKSETRLTQLLRFEEALLDRLADPNLPTESLERIAGVDDDAIDGGRLGDCQREIRSLIRLIPLQAALARAAQVVLEKARERRLKTDAIAIHNI